MSTSAKAMESNLWDHVQFLATSRKDTVVQNSADILLIDSGLPTDAFNRVGRCGLHPKFGMARMEAAINHFRKKEPPAPFTWTVGPASDHGALNETLTGLGLAKTSETVGMLLPLKTFALSGPALPGFDVQPVTTKQHLTDYAALVAASFKPANPHVEKIYTDIAQAILMPNAPLKPYIGYAGGKPVAAIEAFYAHGLVGLSNNVTDVSAAGKGYAPAVMIAALRDAKKAMQNFAFVQADAGSKAIYERIGFKAAGLFADYRPAAAA